MAVNLGRGGRSHHRLEEAFGLAMVALGALLLPTIGGRVDLGPGVVWPSILIVLGMGLLLHHTR